MRLLSSSELRQHPPNTLTFRFFGGIGWRMVLLSEPEFAILFVSDPRGVHRKFKYFTHFWIEDTPLPEVS